MVATITQQLLGYLLKYRTLPINNVRTQPPFQTMLNNVFIKMIPTLLKSFNQYRKVQRSLKKNRPKSYHSEIIPIILRYRSFQISI